MSNWYSEEDRDMPIDPRKLIGDPTFKAPDIVGCVEGWRAWRLPTRPPRFGTTLKLYSATWSDFYWTPRQRAIAKCPHGCAPEQIPNEHCQCGFYSAKSLDHLLSLSYHKYDPALGQFCCIGKVANWGKVIEGSLGWISRYSYPVQIFLPYEAWKLAAPLRESYGVKVTLKDILNIETTTTH